MKRVVNILSAAAPLAIIGGLLYAGLFVKPTPLGAAVARPVFERGDRFYGIATTGGGRVWIAGSNGKILRSDDQGRTWQPQPVPVAHTLQDIAAFDSLRAVAVGNEGLVLVTADGGKSWTDAKAPRSAIANKLLRVKTAADGQAWAVGEGGSLLRSSDYGMSWRRQAGDEDKAWNDVAIRGNRILVVGEFGRARLSVDGGGTWRELSMPVDSSLMAAAFRSDRDAVAVGLGGVVLRSEDGGQSWQRADSSTGEHLYALSWDGARWIAAGAKGVLLSGDAGARHWQASRLQPQDRHWYTALARAGDKYLLAGSRFTTADGFPR